MKYSQRVCSIAMECMQNNTLFALVILFPARIYAVQQYHDVSIFLLFFFFASPSLLSLSTRSSIIKGFDSSGARQSRTKPRQNWRQSFGFDLKRTTKNFVEIRLRKKNDRLKLEIYNFPNFKFQPSVSPLFRFNFNIIISHWITACSNRHLFHNEI